MNPDPDYSAAYVVLHTDQPGLSGHGMTFTIGRGTEVCCAAIEAMRHCVIGRDLDELEADTGAFWRSIAGDSQLRWLGPEKGVIHLATAAVVNAVWDLFARRAKQAAVEVPRRPARRAIVRAVDFRHISDALTPDEALAMLEASEANVARTRGRSARQRLPRLHHLRRLARLPRRPHSLQDPRGVGATGWTALKMKVGRDRDDDVRRTKVLREELGPDRRLLIDANQVWDVDEAIEWTHALRDANPWWIEEPTSPDDILGHARIAAGGASDPRCHR